jgi:hypothetical protein
MLRSQVSPVSEASIMTYDPKIIMSRHNGRFSRGGISVEVCICRLEHTKWSLEIIDNDNNSVVWDGEFETDDEAFEVFMRTVETEGLEGVLRDDPSRRH